MSDEKIALKVSKGKTILFLLAAILGLYFTYFILKSEHELYLRLIFGIFILLLSSFFMCGFIRLNLQKYGTGVLTKEGFYDNHLSINFNWKDIDICILDILNQRRVSIIIKNFESYTKNLNYRALKPYLKSFERNGDHIKIPFPLMNQSLEECIANINKLTEDSENKVQVNYYSLNNESN